MIRDIEELLGKYRIWLQDKTAIREVGDWIEITTPFLDRHNDCIQIYARRDGGAWLLTDDGYTIADLEASGCSIPPSGKRRFILDNTLRGFGVTLGEHELTVRATDAEFAFKKHNLIQAILGAGDLFYLSRSKVISIFFEDVKQWMDERDIRYTPNIQLTGKSGYDHRFDFVLPHSRTSPERLIKLLNVPTRNTAEAAIFSCLDVQATREVESISYAFVNDGRDLHADVTSAFDQYSIKTVLWSRREEVVEELAA
jgi:hypothetical protein